MNIFEEVIRFKSEEEITEIYYAFKHQSEKEAYCKLRTGFIFDRVFNRPQIEWYGLLKDFILEEEKGIVEINEGPSEFFNFIKMNPSERMTTRMNPYLLAKLMKEGIIEKNVQRLLMAMAE